MNDDGARHLRKGYPATLITWIRTRDGWRTETVTGIYDGTDVEGFRLVVDGHLEHRDRDAWGVCIE